MLKLYAVDILKYNQTNQKNSVTAYHHEAGIRLRNLILSKELKVPEDNLTFDKNKYGKPYLVSHPDLKYNISHSENIVLMGISDKEIGVDVEIIRPRGEDDSYFLKLSNRWYGENEKKRMTACEDKKYEFYRLWSRKESLFKLGYLPKNSPFQSYDSLATNFKLKEYQINDTKNNIYIVAVCNDTIGDDFPKAIIFCNFQ